LQTRTAATESVSSVRADKETTAFIELKSAIRKGVDTLSRSGRVPLALSLLGVAPAVFLTLFPQG